MISSKQLGKLRLEHEIDKAIFFSGKIYWLRDKEANCINRAKGIKFSSLTYDDYLDLLNEKNIKHAVKTESKIDWNAGDVKIADKFVTINSDCYTKRAKLYIDNKWVDTSPLSLRLDLVTYKNSDSNLNSVNKNTEYTLIQTEDNTKQTEHVCGCGSGGRTTKNYGNLISYILLLFCIILWLLSKVLSESEEYNENIIYEDIEDNFYRDIEDNIENSQIFSANVLKQEPNNDLSDSKDKNQSISNTSLHSPDSAAREEYDNYSSESGYKLINSSSDTSSNLNTHKNSMIDKNEPLGIKQLFNQNKHTHKNNIIDKDEALGLEKLFKQSQQNKSVSDISNNTTHENV